MPTLNYRCVVRWFHLSFYVIYVAIELGVFSASALLTHFFNALKEKEIIMDNYKEMYYILFNAITEANKILEEAQKKAEEIFMNEE